MAVRRRDGAIGARTPVLAILASCVLGALAISPVTMSASAAATSAQLPLATAKFRELFIAPAAVTATPPSFRSTASSIVTWNTQWAVNRPAGVEEGDFLLACVSTRKRVPASAPAGWTLIREDANPQGVGVASIQRIYVKQAGSLEPGSYTFTAPEPVSGATIIAAYTGVDPVSPVAGSSGDYRFQPGSPYVRAPGLTLSEPGALLVGCYGHNGRRGALPPTGARERADRWSSVYSTLWLGLELSDEELAGTGDPGSPGEPIATGERAALDETLMNYAYTIGQLVALRPQQDPGSGDPPSNVPELFLTLNDGYGTAQAQTYGPGSKLSIEPQPGLPPARVTVGGGASSTHYARVRWVGLDLRLGDEFWVYGDFYLPADFYERQESYMRLLTLDNYALDSTTPRRIGFLLYGSDKLPRLMRQRQGVEETTLLKLQERLPTGRVFQAALHVKLSRVDGEALSEIYLDGALVASTTLANVAVGTNTDGSEPRFTAAGYGIDGASQQDTLVVELRMGNIGLSPRRPW